MKNITKKQIEIVEKMLDGYIMLIGQSETTGRYYYLISKGYDNMYFNRNTFSRLLENELVYQELSYPFNWVLTKGADKRVRAKF